MGFSDIDMLRLVVSGQREVYFTWTIEMGFSIRSSYSMRGDLLSSRRLEMLVQCSNCNRRISIGCGGKMAVCFWRRLLMEVSPRMVSIGP